MNDRSNDSNDLHARLSTELQASASRIPYAGDPARAVARAAQSRRRRTALSAAAGFTLAAGLGVGALSLRPEGSAELITVADGGEGGGDGEGASASLRLEWRATDATVGWPASSFVAADGYRYALSTAPGTRYEGAIQEDGAWGSTLQAIYRTLDGEHWEVIEQDGPMLSDLASLDGLLYAVSTSTDANGEIVNQVLRSSDATDWQATEVPLEFGEVVDPNGLLTFGVGWAHLTVGDDAMIMSATRWSYLDDVELTRHLGLEDVDLGLELMLDGERVEVRDYTACEAVFAETEGVFAATAEEAVVAPPSTIPSSEDVASADEATETTISFDEMPPECEEPPIVAGTTLSELGIEGPLTETVAAISVDGVTWAPIEVPGEQLSFVGGAFVAFNYDESRQLYRSVDGITWEPLSTITGELVGASGDVLVAMDWSSDWGGLAISSDGGASWAALDAQELASELGGPGFVSSVAAGDLGIVAVIGDADFEGPGSPSDWTIVTSTDGVTWTSQNVGEIDGIEAGYPGWAFVDDDHIGVVFSGAKRNADGSVGAVTLLGTPTR